jgi:hypothetical protein
VAALLSRALGLAAAYNGVLLAYWVADGLALYVFARTVGLPRGPSTPFDCGSHRRTTGRGRRRRPIPSSVGQVGRVQGHTSPWLANEWLDRPVGTGPARETGGIWSGSVTLRLSTWARACLIVPSSMVRSPGGRPPRRSRPSQRTTVGCRGVTGRAGGAPSSSPPFADYSAARNRPRPRRGGNSPDGLPLGPVPASRAASTVDLTSHVASGRIRK